MWFVTIYVRICVMLVLIVFFCVVVSDGVSMLVV